MLRSNSALMTMCGTLDVARNLGRFYQAEYKETYGKWG